MTYKRVVFQSSDLALAPNFQNPGGQTPILDFLKSHGLLQRKTVEGPMVQAASAIQTAPTGPPISPKMPLLDLWKTGCRPLRELVVSAATNLNQQQSQNPTSEDMQKRQQEENVKKTEEEKRNAAYSASAIIIAG